jgi:hypothetical protein
MADQLSAADRHQVQQRLDELAGELGLIASWLTNLDLDRPAIVLECCWRDLHAAADLLEPRPRIRPAGWMSAPDGQQGTAGR